MPNQTTETNDNRDKPKSISSLTTFHIPYKFVVLVEVLFLHGDTKMIMQIMHTLKKGKFSPRVPGRNNCSPNMGGESSLKDISRRNNCLRERWGLLILGSFLRQCLSLRGEVLITDPLLQEDHSKRVSGVGPFIAWLDLSYGHMWTWPRSFPGPEAPQWLGTLLAGWGVPTLLLSWSRGLREWGLRIVVNFLFFFFFLTEC